MKWSPDTHDITFDITENEISVVRCADRYRGVDVMELYNMVISENKTINEMDKTEEEKEDIKNSIFIGNKTLADYVV